MYFAVFSELSFRRTCNRPALPASKTFRQHKTLHSDIQTAEHS